MKNPVIIKGNNYGITVILDSAMEFAKLKEYVAEKFRDSAKFLGAAPVVLGFEGRSILPEQEKELLDIITENCELKIMCLVDADEERKKEYEKTLNDKLLELAGASGAFYKGNLRSGQALSFKSSVVILGDVNPGASVISTGNIIVLGSLRGHAFAGADGNKNSFIVAIEMLPVQIRIADCIARSPDEYGKNASKEIKIAFLEKGEFKTEPLSKRIWNEIKL